MGTVDVPTTSLHPVTPAEAKADAATVSSEKWVAHQLNVLKTPLTQLRLLSEHTVLQSLLFWSAAYSPEDEDCDLTATRPSRQNPNRRWWHEDICGCSQLLVEFLVGRRPLLVPSSSSLRTHAARKKVRAGTSKIFS